MSIDNTAGASLARAQWRKSSYSQANGACVEVAEGIPATVPVRDSKDRARLALTFGLASWSAFLKVLKAD